MSHNIAISRVKSEFYEQVKKPIISWESLAVLVPFHITSISAFDSILQTTSAALLPINLLRAFN